MRASPHGLSHTPIIHRFKEIVVEVARLSFAEVQIARLSWQVIEEVSVEKRVVFEKVLEDLKGIEVVAEEHFPEIMRRRAGWEPAGAGRKLVLGLEEGVVPEATEELILKWTRSLEILGVKVVLLEVLLWWRRWGSFIAVSIIERLFLWVREDGVCFADLFEHFLRLLLVVGIFILI